eukprot:gene33677-43349_t
MKKRLRETIAASPPPAEEESVGLIGRAASNDMGGGKAGTKADPATAKAGVDKAGPRASNGRSTQETKVLRKGTTPFCKAHGGGVRCQYEGCSTSARGTLGYCKAHGGVRKCEQKGCNNAALTVK